MISKTVPLQPAAEPQAVVDGANIWVANSGNNFVSKL